MPLLSPKISRFLGTPGRVQSKNLHEKCEKSENSYPSERLFLSHKGTIISHNSYLINENDYFSVQKLHETVEIVETVGRPANRRN